MVASLLDLGLESVDGISVLRGMRLVTIIIIISIITFLIVFAVFVIIIVVISNRSIIGSDCNALITIFLQTEKREMVYSMKWTLKALKL